MKALLFAIMLLVFCACSKELKEQSYRELRDTNGNLPKSVREQLTPEEHELLGKAMLRYMVQRDTNAFLTKSLNELLQEQRTLESSVVE